MTKNKSLTVNVLMTTINQISSILMPLVTFPYVSRILLPDGVGRVAFAQAIVAYFIMIGSLGIPLYGTREVAKVRNDTCRLTQLVVELFLLNGMMTLVSFLFFGVFMAVSGKAATDPLLFWACTLPMLLAPIGFNFLYSGLEEFTFIALRTIVFRILTVIAIFLFVHEATDYWLYVFILGLNTAGSNLINLFFLKRYLSFKTLAIKNLAVLRHLKPALVVFSLGAVISIYTALDKVMLGYLSSDSQIGFYVVSDRLIKVVVLFVTTLGTVLLPRISNYIENGKFEEYGRLVSFSIRAVFFLCFPAAIGLIVLADPLVNMFAGSDYSSAVELVQIMGVNVLFIGMSSFLGFQVLYPHNQERRLILSVFLGAVTNVCFNWVLIPQWHAAGAAVATLCAECVVVCAQIVLARPYRKFNWPFMSIIIYLSSSIFMGGFVYFSLSLFEHDVSRFVIGVLLGGSSYAIIMYLMHDEVFDRLMKKCQLRKESREMP